MLFWYKIHGWQIEDTTGTFKIKNIKIEESIKNYFVNQPYEFNFTYNKDEFHGFNNSVYAFGVESETGIICKVFVIIFCY